MSEQKIIVLAGSKQSGKSSFANFLHGHLMKKNGVVSYFDIDEEGRLLVNAMQVDENGNEQEQQGIIDINQKGYDFAQYASYNIWPYVKSYNFADKLKMACVDIFGLDEKLVFGNNTDKEQLTSIKYSDFAFALFPKELEKMKKDGTYQSYMSIRKVLQFFGTRICRRIQDGCWIDRLVEQIFVEECPMPVIADCRFPNEVETMKKVGAKVIHYLRKIDDDKDESETALDDYQGFDHVIDNREMTVHEKNIATFNYLESIGWLEGPI